MKTKIFASALTTLFAILFTTQLFASEFNFNDEAYIDDIPFNTEMVFHTIINPEFNFEEEAFINDIPFNTALLVNFEMEENYIDDIPFSTNEIVIATTLKEDFPMDEEDYINDIPFNTESIVKLANHDSSLFFAAK